MSRGSPGGHPLGRQAFPALHSCDTSLLQVPSAFRNALWLLAPPKKLEPGQHDLLHEAEAGPAGIQCSALLTFWLPQPQGLQSTGGGADIRRRGKAGSWQAAHAFVTLAFCEDKKGKSGGKVKEAGTWCPCLACLLV